MSVFLRRNEKKKKNHLIFEENLTWFKKQNRFQKKLSYVQANKLPCYRFMDAGRKDETAGSETKDFITSCLLASVPLAPKSYQWHKGSLMNASTQLTVLQERNKFEALTVFITNEINVLCSVEDVISFLKASHCTCPGKEQPSLCLLGITGKNMQGSSGPLTDCFFQ